MKNRKMYLFLLLFVLFSIGQVCFFNYIVKKDKNKEQETKQEATQVDLSNASNVSTIDSKLGDDIVITQGYLMRYVVKKRGIWYQSSGYVQQVSKSGSTSTIKLSSKTNNKEYITLYIDSNKCNVKKGDTVYFVGTMNLDSASMNLAKISKEEFVYSDSTKISTEDLINNMNLLKNTKFIIKGYMITDGDKYKIYDSKKDYNSEGKYFSINWKDTFNFTGNQEVIITCNLGDGYSLNKCVYSE